MRKAAKVPGKVAIGPESRLVEDLAIDSLDLVSLVLRFQDQFDVVIDEDAVPNLCRVADIVAYLAASRRRQRAPGAVRKAARVASDRRSTPQWCVTE